MTEKLLKVISIGELLAMKLPDPHGVRQALKEYAARDLDAAPLYDGGDEEHAHLTRPVHWQGRQWAVTAFGVECLSHHYPIAKDRLWEDEEGYGWVRHISDKAWTDPCDFAEALRIARHIHRSETDAKAR